MLVSQRVERQVDKYAGEGHVPAAAIKRLLAERPSGSGIFCRMLAPNVACVERG
jgi:hypothetical protein